MISLLFDGKRQIDLAHELIGHLLHVASHPLLVVLADVLVLQQLLQGIDAIAPHMADGDPRFLRVAVGDLDHLLAALLVELGNADAQRRPLGGRGQAEVGVADRLLHGADHAAIPNLDRHHARFRHAQGGDLC